MPRQPDIYLELALAALRKVSAFLAHRSLEVYLQDAMCQSAVERRGQITPLTRL